MVYTSGISTIRGGGIACKIRNIIRETCNEVDYTIVTSFEKNEESDLKFFDDLGVVIKGVSKSPNFILDGGRFFRSISSTRFDIIHFHELPMAWDLRFGLPEGLCFLKSGFRGAHLIYEHQIATAGNLHPLHLGWQYSIFKILFNLWDNIIVNSKYMLGEVLRLVNSKFEKIKLIHNGVNLEEIQKAKPMILEGTTLLFFGHLTYIKGVDVLLKAFNKVTKHNPEVHLHIIGDGYLRGFCEKFVLKENLCDKVHFWGAQPQKILFRIIKGADICVLPSRNDAGPLTILEAMAAGKPIITTHVGAIPEVVRDGINGIIVRPDPEQLAGAIEFLLDNDDLRLKIGKKNYQDAEDHSWKRVSQEYVKIYKSLLNK